MKTEAQLKRRALLRAAAQLFNEKGYHATSLDEVARRLDVTKPTIYKYIKSKDQILFDCMRLGIEMMREAIAEAEEAGGSSRDKLRAAMAGYARIVTLDFGQCLVKVGEEHLPADSKQQLRRLKAEMDQEFRKLIFAAMEEGAIRQRNPKIVTFVVAGALGWIGRWYNPAGPETAEQIADQCIDILMEGII